MAALSLSITAQRPLNRWDHDRIQPGVVGSVGDTLISSRLKHNMPDSKLRWAPGSKSIYHGSNISDGMFLNISSLGGPAKLVDSNWGSRRDFKTSHGWIYQDMREIDKNVEPIMGGTPDYSWNNKIATALKANVVGNQFLPLPNGYQPSATDRLRGGKYPVTTNIAEADAPPRNGLEAGGQVVGDDLDYSRNATGEPRTFGQGFSFNPHAMLRNQHRENKQ